MIQNKTFVFYSLYFPAQNYILQTTLRCFSPLFNGDDPFSVSQNVLRERGKYAYNFQCVEICIEGKLCMLASGNEMYKVHDW